MTTPEQDMEESRRLLQRANHYLYGDGADPVTGAGFAQMAAAQALLAQAGFIRDALHPSSTRETTDICTCGHMRVHHVYETGACRPGTVCPANCREFKEAF
jgi:hypothetical protein